MNEERARDIPVDCHPDEIALLKRYGSVRVEGENGMKGLLGEARAFTEMIQTAKGVMNLAIEQALADGWPPFREARVAHGVTADEAMAALSVTESPEGYSTAVFRIREGGFPEIQLRCRMP